MLGVAPTERLYFDDPFLREFTARVVEHASIGGRASVVLDRSAFYPEGGGQLPDRGVLAGVVVDDVQVDDVGLVHHVLAGERPPVGSEVQASIDWPRRRVHMALHTGQHVLSRALLDVLSAETVSSRLGESGCTIDVSRPKCTEAEVAKAEDLANAVVDDDVEVVAFFPDPAELAELPLRRTPKVEDEVRVVRVGDFDVTPCGGTHCTRSAQIGLVRILGVERYKGGTRVTFEAGRRARSVLSEESALLRSMARELTCGPLEVAAAIGKLRRELTTARDTLGKVRATVAERVARELWEAASERGEHRIVTKLEDMGPDEARVVASRIASHPEAVALIGAPTDGGLHVVVMRGEASAFDCGAFLKAAARATGGRGGGRPERAEGRLPADADWDAVARAAED